jgi:hypothetical protein
MSTAPSRIIWSVKSPREGIFLCYNRLMERSIKIGIIITSATLILCGCGFGYANKTTKINLQSSQSVVAENNAPPTSETNKANTDSNNDSQNGNAAGTNQASDNSANNNQKNNFAAGANDNSPTPDSTSPLKIISRLVSWGFSKSSGRKIDTIIIHSSYNAVGSDPHNVDDIINKEYKPNGVSPHYIIGRDGKIYQLVADQNIAYHAGVSKMPDGRTNVNNFSIGIEIVETGSESPSSAQYSSLKYLVSYLKGKYKIKNILGHSDIAPGRKDDPWNFDWNKIK